MQSEQPNLFTRDDTFFGVCEGLGQDFGIHPNILRVALGGALFWNPPAAAAVYLTAGLIVLATRLIVPEPGPAKVPESACAAGVPDEVAAPVEQEPVALAA
ncbi:MAG TPA: PspC domain-containing protein [Allosphingosinicella sp.]|nr:PspC domain-containing protein [Allosphingosinicella sp.]